jgi:membrane protein implicated in regulation of membrane protease activity
MKFLAMVVAAVVTLSVTPAMAYVGPGAGLSLLGAFWGLLVAILAAISFVILYPIRRLVRARKRPAEAPAPADLRSDGQAAER